ncbi:thyrotropin-releasing hormone receptor-like [Arctopsyche grandis]|uniref:thyrotropin-releasing hormone receptor-like n=1 Tax=Arctopsyche grandis TaxID=121162 RepID=UPI00406D70E8
MISTIASVVGPFSAVTQSPTANHLDSARFQPSVLEHAAFLYGNRSSPIEGRPVLQRAYRQDELYQSSSSSSSTTAPVDVDDANSSLVHLLSSVLGSGGNGTGPTNSTDGDYSQIPAYIRTTSMVFCIIIMCLGVVGNVMVPIVIMKTKDMRNSTNIFLMNLSIADLMVLLVCTPTVLVEVNTRPETWVLGKEMCLAVPFVELTVAHASVLTILAISFERYYAICEPLKAGYVCTKTRAALICFLAWFVAAVFTSPILAVADYREDYPDGSKIPACLTQATNFWPALYFLMTISLFFLIPFLILLVLYTIIAKNLISTASKVVMNKHVDGYNFRARRQVVMMLGTVILSFFICLMPFKFLTLWIIIVPDETVNKLGVEKYYNILYFSRTMLYLNSAVNPILYNLMSSKFRDGFLLVCRLKKKHDLKNYKRGCRNRAGTFHTSSTTCTSSSVSRRSNSLKHAIFKRASFDSSIESGRSPVFKKSILEANDDKRSRFNRSISVLPNIMLLKNCDSGDKTVQSSAQGDASVKIVEEDETRCDISEEDANKPNPAHARSDFQNNRTVRRPERVPFLNKQRSLDSAGFASNYSLRKHVILRSVKSKSVDHSEDSLSKSKESFV